MRWGCSAKCEQIEAKFPTCQRCFAHMSVPLQNDDSAQGVGNRTEMRVTCAVGTVRAQSARMWGMSGQFRVSFGSFSFSRVFFWSRCNPLPSPPRNAADDLDADGQDGVQ